jgi:hypothetical protein
MGFREIVYGRIFRMLFTAALRTAAKDRSRATLDEPSQSQSRLRFWVGKVSYWEVHPTNCVSPPAAHFSRRFVVPHRRLFLLRHLESVVCGLWCVCPW